MYLCDISQVHTSGPDSADQEVCRAAGCRCTVSAGFTMQREDSPQQQPGKSCFLGAQNPRKTFSAYGKTTENWWSLSQLAGAGPTADKVFPW